MAILNESDAYVDMPGARFEGFDDFGANDDYCNRTYPANVSPQTAAWNAQCKKSCSGLACVSKPGLLASPWTIVGKSARGLPDDTLLGQVLRPALAAGGAGPGVSVTPPAGGAPGGTPRQEAGILGGIDTNVLLIGGLGLAAFFVFSQRGGRGRGRSFSGYSRQHRRTRRTRRGSKRRS